MVLWRQSRSQPTVMALIAITALLVLIGCFFYPPGPINSVFVELQCPMSSDDASSSSSAAVHGLHEDMEMIDTEIEQTDKSSDDEQDNLSIEMKISGDSACNESTALLKVFMYDLPSEFHFGMLNKVSASDQIWPGVMNMSEIPRYPGGLNLQHSIEYWLTLDLLSSVRSRAQHTCTAVLVHNTSDADIFFVPFFSSLSYNRYSKSDGSKDRNTELQDKLTVLLRKQGPWRRSGGRDHVIVMHHPNSLHVAREQLRSAVFVVSDFGRYSPQVANIGKDIVAPYKHMVPTYTGDNSSYESRETLLYFQGAIFRKEGGMIRQKLYQMLKDEPGVHFSMGSTQRDGIRSASMGMRNSKFCLNLAGDTPSSNRLFDAIVSHCVPVIISDEIELPFEEELDYSEFCLLVRAQDALQKGFLMDLLQNIRQEEWNRMWMRLKEVDHHFEFQHPSLPNDGVNMIWKSIARRVPSVKQALHKAQRYSRSINRS